jgi:hypothetical protein
MEKSSTHLPSCPLWPALHDFFSLNKHKTFSNEELQKAKKHMKKMRTIPVHKGNEMKIKPH